MLHTTYYSSPGLHQNTTLFVEHKITLYSLLWILVILIMTMNTNELSHVWTWETLTSVRPIPYKRVVCPSAADIIVALSPGSTHQNHLFITWALLTSVVPTWWSFMSTTNNMECNISNPTQSLSFHNPCGLPVSVSFNRPFEVLLLPRLSKPWLFPCFPRLGIPPHDLSSTHRHCSLATNQMPMGITRLSPINKS